MKPNWQILGFLVLVVVALFLRLNSYEGFDRSVSNFDTQRYASSGEVPFFSAEFLTNIRQPTIALAYQLAEPAEGYQVTNLSSPGDYIQPALSLQPGFNRITLIQSLVATFTWILLAWVVFQNLSNRAIKFLGASLVLLFGFVPQMVEWDYIMLSEPLSLSLFVTLFALSIELVARVAKEGNRLGRNSKVILVVWFVNATLWLFARDTNAYLLLVFAAALIVLTLWRPLREKLPWRVLLASGLLLIVLFSVGSTTSQLSGRWVNPYFNNLLARVLPVPEYRAFFEARGLPVTEELLAEVGGNLSELSLFEQEDLTNWVEEHGTKTYIEFILTHPGWAIGTFGDGIVTAFTENAQPFFKRNDQVTSDFIVYLGDLLHPKAANAVLVVAIQLLILLVLTLKRSALPAQPLAGLFCLFFLGEMLMFFVSIHGDAAGLIRHSIGSVMPLRLSLWLLPPFILDALSPTAKPARHKK